MERPNNPDFFIESRSSDNGAFIVHVNLDSRTQAASDQPRLGRWFVLDRGQILELMNHGRQETSTRTFMTIFQRDGIWHYGSEVHVVHSKTGEYLRTNRNEIDEDDLGNLRVWDFSRP